MERSAPPAAGRASRAGSAAGSGMGIQPLQGGLGRGPRGAGHPGWARAPGDPSGSGMDPEAGSTDCRKVVNFARPGATASRHFQKRGERSVARLRPEWIDSFLFTHSGESVYAGFLEHTRYPHLPTRVNEVEKGESVAFISVCCER